MVFPPGFPHQNPVYTSPLTHTRYTSHPSHSSRFLTRKIFGEQYRSLSSSLCSFLHSSVTSSPLGPNILLRTLFSNTLSLSSSLNVSDQDSHPYKTTNKIIVHELLHFDFVHFDVEYIYGFVMLGGGFVRQVDDVTAYLAAQPSRLRVQHRNITTTRWRLCVTMETL